MRSHIVVQFLLITLIACSTTFGLYHFISEVIPAHFFLGELYQDYWNEQVKETFETFQEYVTANNLSREQAMNSSWWYSSNTNVTLFFDPLPFVDTKNPEHQSYLKKNSIYVLTCSNGDLFATSYSPGVMYRKRWETWGILIGMTCAFIIFFAYIFHLLHRLKKLYRQIMLSTQQGGDTTIYLRGEDELACLAQKVESMRCSLLDLLEQEQESQKNQTQLIAMLSHDIRTPLTKLMGYLDILCYQKVASPEQMSHYLSMANEKANQLKTLTDNLLSCVFVKGKMIPDDRVLVNGPEFLAQILYEGCFDLESNGFTVELSSFDGEYTLNVSIDAFQRICDNLSSNILKYANKEHPICVHVTNSTDFIHLSISNYKASKSSDIPHHGLGLPSVRELTEYLGGTFSVIDTKEQFEVCIALPKVSRHSNKTP